MNLEEPRGENISQKTNKSREKIKFKKKTNICNDLWWRTEDRTHLIHQLPLPLFLHFEKTILVKSTFFFLFKWPTTTLKVNKLGSGKRKWNIRKIVWEQLRLFFLNFFLTFFFSTVCFLVCYNFQLRISQIQSWPSICFDIRQFANWP